MAETIETWLANSSTRNTPGAIKNLVPMGTHQPDFNIFDDFNVAKCHLGEVNLESLRPAVFPTNLQAWWPQEFALKCADESALFTISSLLENLLPRPSHTCWK